VRSPPNFIVGAALHGVFLTQLGIPEVLVAGVGPDGAAVSLAAVGVVELEGDFAGSLAFEDARVPIGGSQ
jgi:hypothetical protein